MLVDKSKSSWIRQTVLLAAFLAPVAYLGLLFAVFVHEALGHGLMAVLLGGDFHGFELHWDGMGFAYTSLEAGASTSERIAHLAAGNVASTVIGVALLVGAVFVRKHILLRLVLLILSEECLLEGPSYVLWNAWVPVPPGDVGRIIQMAGSPNLRWVLVAIGGALTVVTIVALTALLFQAIEQVLGHGRRLMGLRRAITLGLFLGVPGAAGWFLFDWNQLAPGIGRLPQFAGAGIMLVVPACLYRWSLPPNPSLPSVRVRYWHAILTWIALVATVILVYFYGQGPDYTSQEDVENFQHSAPVAYAVITEDMGALNALLTSGADPNVADPIARITPLGWAALKGNYQAFQLLLNHDSQVNLDAGEGAALFFAVMRGQLRMVEDLVSRKAHIDNRGPLNLTPLMVAASSGHIEIVRVLLKAGADPTLIDNQSQSAADMAKQRGYADIVEIIEEGIINTNRPRD